MTDKADEVAQDALAGGVDAEPGSGIDVVLVTGLSGAGRGTAAKVLEDLGWYVADNLPPELIARMVDLGSGRRIPDHPARRRDGRAVARIHRRPGLGAQRTLATRDITPRVLFLEASDDILVRRYEQNRRSHPLQGDQTLAEGIAAERAMLAPVRAGADLVIDTSTLSVPALRESIERAFGGEAVADDQRHGRVVRVQVRPADGRRHGDGRPVPAEPALGRRAAAAHRPAPGGARLRARPTGRGASSWTPTIELLDLVVEGYRREGKRYMTVAIGCTGGKHRSVAMAEALAALLQADPSLSVRVLHRDLGRE